MKLLTFDQILLCFRSVFLGWTTSIAVGVALTACFKSSLTTFSWNPFASHIKFSDVDQLSHPNVQQTILLVLALLAFVVGCGIIVVAYYRIFLSLYSAKPVWRNKVAPWNRASSLSSDDNDLTMSTGYGLSDNNWSKSTAKANTRNHPLTRTEHMLKS